MISKLDHPNIMKIYEYFEDENQFFIISEYCTGGELFEKISHLQAFNEKIAARIIKQLLSALFYLHSNNIIHSNVNSQHILLEINWKSNKPSEENISKGSFTITKRD